MEYALAHIGTDLGNERWNAMQKTDHKSNTNRGPPNAAKYNKYINLEQHTATTSNYYDAHSHHESVQRIWKQQHNNWEIVAQNFSTHEGYPSSGSAEFPLTFGIENPQCHKNKNKNENKNDCTGNQETVPLRDRS